MKKGNDILALVVYGETLYSHKPLPDWVRTPEMYMPVRQTSDQMTLLQAKRGLCHKSGGSIDVCRQCPAPCPMGKRCMELTEEVQKA